MIPAKIHPQDFPAGGFLPEHDESPVHKLKRNDSSGLIEGGVFFWNIERNL